APVVDAGPDQTVTLAAGATLSGTATEVGLAIGSTLSVTWTKISGPGTVTFGNARALSTTAKFSTTGTYVLRLTATDGASSASDDISLVVLNQWGPVYMDTESITMMGGALGLEGQPSWFYYNGADAPGGAYMGWLYQAQTLTGSIRLPRQLTTGR